MTRWKILCAHTEESFFEKVHGRTEDQSGDDRALSECPFGLRDESEDYGEEHKKNIDPAPECSHGNTHAFCY